MSQYRHHGKIAVIEVRELWIVTPNSWYVVVKMVMRGYIRNVALSETDTLALRLCSYSEWQESGS